MYGIKITDDNDPVSLTIAPSQVDDLSYLPFQLDAANGVKRHRDC